MPTWEPLKVGAGGYITGMDVDPMGTTYVLRTDTYGAYVGNGADAWRQVVSATSMPASFIRSFTHEAVQSLGEGVYEIRVAPSRPSRVYMIFRRIVWRSDDRGAAWTQTSSGYVAGGIDPNDGTRYYGQKMAVDPANADVVYAGAARGLYVTTNGGRSWNAVSAVAAPTDPAHITGIVFDPRSGTTGGRTNTIYAVSNGRGVYRSADAGGSWSLLSGGPTTASHAAIAKDGAYYVANRSSSVYRYAAGTWKASAETGQTLHSIATDPFDAARIVVGRDSGHLAVSTDRGASWLGGGIIWSGGAATRVAPDVPWLAFATESYMSNGSMLFDPRVQDKLWFAEGIGVWYSTDPGDTKKTTWHSHSAGIEQLVARDVLVPPGSSHVFTAGMDRGVFRVAVANTSYPSDHVTMGSTKALLGGWALDYSRTNPSHLVAIINGQGAGDLSGYSVDAGATWTRFPVQPAVGISGDIIAPSIDNIVAIIGIDGFAYRSTDRGVSWKKLAGVPGSLHDGFIVKKHVLAVDGAYDGSKNKTLYLYAARSGTWRSTDDGSTWRRMSKMVLLGDYYHVKLRSVPGRAGHLFLVQGQTGGETNRNPHADALLWRSVDGGATWAVVSGMGEPYDVALGKPAPGRTYPAIYVIGWYKGTYGIWRSTDDAATWTQIGPFPFGSVDEINVIKASQDVYGDVYVAFQGSGWGYGKLRSAPGASR